MASIINEEMYVRYILEEQTVADIIELGNRCAVQQFHEQEDIPLHYRNVEKFRKLARQFPSISAVPPPETRRDCPRGSRPETEDASSNARFPPS